jgi:hypothetical protein
MATVLQVEVALWGCTVGKYGGREMIRAPAGEACKARLVVSNPSISILFVSEHCQCVDQMFDALRSTAKVCW